MSPEFIPHVADLLFEAGALDVYTTGIAMKKGRHGIMLSVLAECSLEREILALIFRETTSIGVRKFYVDREELVREKISFESSLGMVAFKESYMDGELMSYKPEYDDLKRIAVSEDIPIKKAREIIVWEYGEARHPGDKGE